MGGFGGGVGEGGSVRLVLCHAQVMMNMDRLLKHAVQEKLAITICINKVSATPHVLPSSPAAPSVYSPLLPLYFFFLLLFFSYSSIASLSLHLLSSLSLSSLSLSSLSLTRLIVFCLS